MALKKAKQLFFLSAYCFPSVSCFKIEHRKQSAAVMQLATEKLEEMFMASLKEQLESGNIILGLELGSTRIKAVFIGENHLPAAEGSFTWENQLSDGIWTYSLDDVWKGIQAAYQACTQDAMEKYQTVPTSLSAVGLSLIHI